MDNCKLLEFGFLHDIVRAQITLRAPFPSAHRPEKHSAREPSEDAIRPLTCVPFLVDVSLSSNTFLPVRIPFYIPSDSLLTRTPDPSRCPRSTPTADRSRSSGWLRGPSTAPTPRRTTPHGSRMPRAGRARSSSGFATASRLVRDPAATGFLSVPGASIRRDPRGAARRERCARRRPGTTRSTAPRKALHR